MLWQQRQAMALNRTGRLLQQSLSQALPSSSGLPPPHTHSTHVHTVTTHCATSPPRRYDEFGRRKRSKGEEDKRAREQAALQRLYGGTNLAPSEMVSRTGVALGGAGLQSGLGCRGRGSVTVLSVLGSCGVFYV